MAGMSGIGAKGSMCYGLITANLIKAVDLPEKMYQVTRDMLAIKDVF